MCHDSLGFPLFRRRSSQNTESFKETFTPWFKDVNIILYMKIILVIVISFYFYDYILVVLGVALYWGNHEEYIFTKSDWYQNLMNNVKGHFFGNLPRRHTA